VLRQPPLRLALAGALTIAWSAVLVKAADVSPSDAAIFRCAYAVPFLWWLARRVDAWLGPRAARSRRLAWLAGVIFAVDLVCWHHSIEDVGAGLATVLGNLQVAIVPLVAWAVLKEHPSARVLASLPVVFGGVILISGVLEHEAFGPDPARGTIFGVATGMAYAAFLLFLRAAGADLRRPAGPLFDATWTCAVAAIVIGLPLGEVNLVPSWPAHGYLLLLALSSQVLGWLLISTSLPRLPAARTSVVLTIQPIGSMILGAIFFSESPTALQIVGCAAILTGLVAVTAQRRRIAV
jgi:drug/metabolite transporter (DMT)-like permease